MARFEFLSSFLFVSGGLGVPWGVVWGGVGVPWESFLGLLGVLWGGLGGPAQLAWGGQLDRLLERPLFL